MITAVVVVGLASLYIAYTVSYLDGPFGLYRKILAWTGVIQPVYGYNKDIVDYVEVAVEDRDRFITKLVGCFWCLTTWVCLALTVIYVNCSSLNFGQGMFVWLASSGLSGYLHERLVDGEN